MTDFTAAELAELRTGLRRFGVFIALESDPPCRYWGGVGNIQPGTNAVDETGTTYKGFGEITEVDDLLSVFDGTASRISLSVAQIPVSVFSTVAAQVADQQAAIQGKEVFIGWAAMGSRWDLLGPVRWEWSGFADSLTVRRTGATAAEGQASWALILSCGDWLTGVRRPGLSFLADNDQKTRAAILNPTANPDRFAERTGRYSVGTNQPLPVNP